MSYLIPLGLLQLPLLPQIPSYTATTTAAYGYEPSFHLHQPPAPAAFPTAEYFTHGAPHLGAPPQQHHHQTQHYGSPQHGHHHPAHLLPQPQEYQQHQSPHLAQLQHQATHLGPTQHQPQHLGRLAHRATHQTPPSDVEGRYTEPRVYFDDDPPEQSRELRLAEEFREQRLRQIQHPIRPPVREVRRYEKSVEGDLDFSDSSYGRRRRKRDIPQLAESSRQGSDATAGDLEERH